MSALITADRVAALNPCSDYSEEKLRALLPQGRNVAGCLSLLLSLPHQDARWVLARLLSAQGRIAWANGCAQRAKRAAARATARAAAASTAADYASTAADYAADYEAAASAASAAAAADYASTAAYSETKLQCVLGLELLAAGFIND